MEIEIARINKMTLQQDALGKRFVKVSCGYDLTGIDFIWILSNPTDAQRLMKLMSYTEATDGNDLKGKIIRVVNDCNVCRGFGHPTEDRFVPLDGEEFQEVTEEQFQGLLGFLREAQLKEFERQLELDKKEFAVLKRIYPNGYFGP